MSELPMRGHFRYLRFKNFQWNQEHPNARCFSSCCWALNIRESRRTPTPNFSKCWASPPDLAKVGVWHTCTLGSTKHEDKNHNQSQTGKLGISASTQKTMEKGRMWEWEWRKKLRWSSPWTMGIGMWGWSSGGLQLFCYMAVSLFESYKKLGV